MPPRHSPISEHTERTTPTASRMAASAAMPASASASAMQPYASRRYDESWVEIASQPSSSSLSSIADEIVVTGLRVGSSAIDPNRAVIPQRRRRLLQQVEAAAAGTRSAALAQQTASTSSPSFPHSSAGSSQDEYDETESEEDQALPASVGGPAGLLSFAVLPSIPLTAQAQTQHRAAASDGDDEEDEEEEEDDDDDNGTALGMPSSGPPVFRPQPNAFTHPPSLLQQQQQLPQQHPQLQQHRSMPTPPPYPYLASPYAGSTAPPRAVQARTSRASSSPYLMSPSYREDNDAALRASLTTLLSCAAAARGLPRKENESYGEPSGAAAAGVRPSNQPIGLRLAPESELMAEAPVAPRSHARPSLFHQQQARATTASDKRPTARAQPTAAAGAGPTTHLQVGRGSSGSAVSTSSKSKRTAAAASGAGATSRSSPRATKKKRTSAAADGDATATFVSPTLLTWVVSAGVVVLVSVVGFGAGFVIGREVGRQEAVSAAALSSSGNGGVGAGAAANATASCGHEIMRSSTGSSLRRFRWGAGMTKTVMA